MKHLAKRAVQIYPMKDYADRKAVIHLRKSWLRSVLKLGNKWILFIDKNADAAVVVVCLAMVPVLWMVM